MCGIHFTMTQDTFATRTDEYMKQAFVANSLRGMHSSGMFQVNNKHEIAMYKQAMNGTDFISTEGAKRLLNLVPRSPLTVGHVRHATQGVINDDNAHPFLITRDDGSELVGVHNGTLRNWKNKKGGDKGTVDSAWAFQMLADEGDDAFQYFDGAFALVWYDTAEPDVMYMARNKERPLHFMTTKDRRTILGASELGMLGWLAERNNLEPATEKNISFRYLEPDRIYKFSLKDIGAFESYEMMKYDPRTTIYTPPVNNHYGMHPSRGWNGYSQGGNSATNDDYDDSYEWPTRRYDGWRPYVDPKQDKLLKDTEEALDRVAEMMGDVLPDDAGLEAARKSDPATFEAINQSIKRWQKAKKNGDSEADLQAVRAESILSSNAVFVTPPNDKAANREEIARAKHMGVYGQVGKFYGILYDEEESNILGQLEIYRRGTQMEVEGEVRFVTKRAEDKYITPVEPNIVVIVGVVPPSGAFKETYVVADLTDSNKAAMSKHVERLAKAN